MPSGQRILLPVLTSERYEKENGLILSMIIYLPPSMLTKQYHPRTGLEYLNEVKLIVRAPSNGNSTKKCVFSRSFESFSRVKVNFKENLPRVCCSDEISE